jgi:hypothetical protein
MTQRLPTLSLYDQARRPATGTEKRTGEMRKVITTRVDDLDGSDAAETVRFGIGGTSWEIDLSAPNAARLRKELGPYVNNARRPGSAPASRYRTRQQRERARQVRIWAASRGIKVSDKGRISQLVQARYDASH